MIATVEHRRRNCNASERTRFLNMLPRIRSQARIAFRGLRREAKEEVIAEVVANAFCAFSRLSERGLLNRAYATPLAKYAIRQVRAGRLVGGRLNMYDISARYAQLTSDIGLERLDRFNPEENEWRALLIEDRRAGPAETAAARLDLAAWFRSLACRNRRIARALAAGEAPGRVAKMFRLSAGRMSQLRKELWASWEQFQGSLAIT